MPSLSTACFKTSLTLKFPVMTSSPFGFFFTRPRRNNTGLFDLCVVYVLLSNVTSGAFFENKLFIYPNISALCCEVIKTMTSSCSCVHVIYELVDSVSAQKLLKNNTYCTCESNFVTSRANISSILHLLYAPISEERFLL